MPVVIDLHVHTTYGSQCSRLRPQELIRAARRRRLDGLCITEHNYCWDDHAFNSLAEAAWEEGIRLFRGIEVTTDRGHVLVFGLPGFISGIHRLGRLRQVVEEYGGLMILAHPVRQEGLLVLSNGSLPLDYVDALEVYNGTYTEAERQEALDLAGKFGLLGVGGSDAHDFYSVGSSVTILDYEVETEAELIAAISQRRCCPAQSTIPRGSWVRAW